MLHTIEIPKRDLSNVDQTFLIKKLYHEISSYCMDRLKEFKGGNIIVKENVVEDSSIFQIVRKK